MKRLLLVQAILLFNTFGLLSQDNQRVIVIKPSRDEHVTTIVTDEKENVRTAVDLKLQSLSFGFTSNKLKEKDGMNLKSNFGLFANYTRTYLLNSTPSVLNYGLDIVYADLNYVNYKLLFQYQNAETTEYIHQAEFGMQGGLALLWAPSERFNAKVFGRYAPTYTGLYHREKWHFNYSNYIVAGITLNFMRFGIGGEFRYGFLKSESLNLQETENATSESNQQDFINSGFRVFVNYNF